MLHGGQKNVTRPSLGRFPNQHHLTPAIRPGQGKEVTSVKVVEISRLKLRRWGRSGIGEKMIGARRDVRDMPEWLIEHSVEGDGMALAPMPYARGRIDHDPDGEDVIE